MRCLSNKRIILGVITLTTLLFLMIVLPGLSLKELSIQSYGTIDYGIDTRVGRFVNGTYYVEVVKDGTSEIVYNSVDADEVINYAISISIGGIVFVAYTGSDYEIDNAINMRTGVTLLLDNNVRIKQTADKSIVSFAGTAERHLMYANITSFGQGILSGDGSGGSGIMFTYSEYCSLSNCEIVNLGRECIVMRFCDYNVLENLYCHSFAHDGEAKGILFDDVGYTKVLNCTVDGADGQSSTLLYCGSDYGTGMYNEIIGGQFINSQTSSGIYFCSAGAGGRDGRVDHAVIKDVYIANCGSGLGSGDCGIKLRPCSYCTVTGVVVEGCDMGMELSTHLGGTTSANPHSHDNYIQGNFSNNLACGLNIEPGKDGMLVIDNTFDVITENNGHHGIRIVSAGWDGAEISRNTFQVESRFNGWALAQSGGILLDSDSNTYLDNNEFIGISEDNVGYGIFIIGSNVRNTVFTGTLQNNGKGDVYDTGTTTTINLTTPKYGSISGTVTDNETGNPIENVTVICGSISCQTNATGHYSLSDITVGTRTLMATKDGYLDYITSVKILEDQTTIHNIKLIEEV